MRESKECLIEPDTQDVSIYKHPLVQTLLDQLPKSPIKTSVQIDLPITKRFVEEGKLIIAGYASVEMIDTQNELIPLPVLKESWENFRKNKDFKVGSLMHSNIPVVKVLDEYTDSKEQVWKSGVDDTGLFIVAEVRDDIQKGKQTRELIEKGVLIGFSIGGEALASTTICEGKCYTRIDKMELHEIAVVDKPANKPSVFVIVKRLKQEVIKPKVSAPVVRLDFTKLNKAIDLLSKRVERRGNQWCVVHCTGPDAGKPIKCFPTKPEADKMHRAIMVNKQAEKPPKAEWDRCTSRAEGIESIKNPAAFCGNLWYNDRGKWNAFVKVMKGEEVIISSSIEKIEGAISILRGNSRSKTPKRVN